MSRNGHERTLAPELANVEVVNRHHYSGAQDNSYSYIGRGTPLGNNWSHVSHTTAQFRVATREQAVDQYRHWLWQEIQRGTGPAFTTLSKLTERAIKGEKVVLSCSCKPDLCHGDVVKGAIEHLAQRYREQELAKSVRTPADPQFQTTKTIFVCGSRSITSLAAAARTALDKIISRHSAVLIGDASGSDHLVQQYLAAKQYSNVTVCHIGDAPRHNAGFNTQHVEGNRQADKDAYMARSATEGLAIWDGRSPGTAKNIERLETTVIEAAPVKKSSRGNQALNDILAQGKSDDFRSLYNVEEGLTRGQHTTRLHSIDQLARDAFERGATITDSVLSIPKDVDSRPQDATKVTIGTEAHALHFVSAFIKDPKEAREKGQHLFELGEKACGQWTDSHGRLQVFTHIYDQIRKDENGAYRSNEDRAAVIDRVIEETALWAEQLPAPDPEPTAQEVHEFTLALAAENREASLPEPQPNEDLQIDRSLSEKDPHLLYLHELQSNSHGLATIGELTGLSLPDFSESEPAAIGDESQVYGELLEEAVFEEYATPEGDHLGAERQASDGRALDATFDRINLESLPPSLPDSLTEEGESHLLSTLLPMIDAQIESGLSKREILSPIHKANRTNEAHRFGQRVEKAFGRNAAQAPSREDQLNALSSLRLLVAAEYRHETKHFGSEALEWSKGNYRLNPDRIRAAGKLKVGEYAQVINSQNEARAAWLQIHHGEQAPTRTQIDRINALEAAGHKINNRISALNPTKAELLQSLNNVQSRITFAAQSYESRLTAYAACEERGRTLDNQAREYADQVRARRDFQSAKTTLLNNDHERNLDQLQALNRGNNVRFAYLVQPETPSPGNHDAYAELLDSAKPLSAFAELSGDNQIERRAETTKLVQQLTNPDIETDRLNNARELADHQRFFTQITGREISSSADGRSALQPMFSSLAQVSQVADQTRSRLDPGAAPQPDLAIEPAPVYVSLTSNEYLRIPVATLPEYDALTNAVHDCRLETSTWRSLHTPAPITGRDEERDAIASFVGDYVDFRLDDHATEQLARNPLFRVYSERLGDARTTEEIVETAVAIRLENYRAFEHLKAHRADPAHNPGPAMKPLTVSEMRELFHATTPAIADRATRAAMRDTLRSMAVFGKEKTERVALLTQGKIEPSPALARLLDNLATRNTKAALDHFYLSLRNPAATLTRQNSFDLYQAHRGLPQYERDHLHQHALAAKYEALKDETRTEPAVYSREQEAPQPVVATVGTETAAYREYYARADLREAQAATRSLANQNGVDNHTLEQSSLVPEFTDFEVRTISYIANNFGSTRLAQTVEHLRESPDPHQQAFADMVALAGDVRARNIQHELTPTDLQVPGNYAVSPDSVRRVISYSQQHEQRTSNERPLSQDTLVSIRQTAQQEAWRDVQQQILKHPGRALDAPATFFHQAKDLHQRIERTAQLQERARIAFHVLDSHLTACTQRVEAALTHGQSRSESLLPFQNRSTEQKALTRSLVQLALDPQQKDSNGILKANAREFQAIQQILTPADVQQTSQFREYAATAREQYLASFVELDRDQQSIRATETQLAEVFAQAHTVTVNDRMTAAKKYASVREEIERSILADHMAQALVKEAPMDLSRDPTQASVRDLIPQDVRAAAQTQAREQAWQSFAPQELADSRAGHVIDERTLNIADQVMDKVATAQTIDLALNDQQDQLTAFIDDKLSLAEGALRDERATTTYENTFREVVKGAAQDASRGQDAQPTEEAQLPGLLNDTTIATLVDQAQKGEALTATQQTVVLDAHAQATLQAQDVREQAFYASLADRDNAREKTVSELKGPEAQHYAALKENIQLNESRLDQAFVAIDDKFSELNSSRAAVRIEQQLLQYRELAKPTSEKINDYLKGAAREEGFRALMEPLRHDDHVERIALTIIETAQQHNVSLDRSPEGLAQVQEIAAHLFDTLRIGMERANHHLFQNQDLTHELQRDALALNEPTLAEPGQPAFQPPTFDAAHQNGNGHHLDSLATLDKHAQPHDQLKDITDPKHQKDSVLTEREPTVQTIGQSPGLNNSTTDHSFVDQSTGPEISAAMEQEAVLAL